MIYLHTVADLEMKVGRFRLNLVRKVVMWSYVICQSFSFHDLFSVEFWISALQGSPEADFQPNFGLFSSSLSNVQLISDKTKTIFVMPYPWASVAKSISSRRFFVSLWLLLQLREATGNGLFFKPYIFHARVLYHEVFSIPGKFSPKFTVYQEKKDTKVEVF